MTADRGRDHRKSYTVESSRVVNDEGSEFVTLTIRFDDGHVTTERFASYFDDPGESATVQAASFIAAFDEAEERRAEADRLGVHPLELAFAPFGPEWEREQEERHADR